MDCKLVFNGYFYAFSFLIFLDGKRDHDGKDDDKKESE